MTLTASWLLVTGLTRLLYLLWWNKSPRRWYSSLRVVFAVWIPYIYDKSHSSNYEIAVLGKGNGCMKDVVSWPSGPQLQHEFELTADLIIEVSPSGVSPEFLSHFSISSFEPRFKYTWIEELTRGRQSHGRLDSMEPIQISSPKTLITTIKKTRLYTENEISWDSNFWRIFLFDIKLDF